MNKAVMSLLSIGLAALAACGSAALEGGNDLQVEPYTVNTQISEVIACFCVLSLGRPFIRF